MTIVNDVLKLVGLGESHPELPPEHPAAVQLAELEQPLGELAEQAKDRLELVPGRNTHYVFIGKPPKAFGLAWIHDGKWSNFKNLTEDHGVGAARLESLVEHLRSAYQKSEGAERYAATVAEHDIVITPSEALAEEVGGVIDEVLAEHAS